MIGWYLVGWLALCARPGLASRCRRDGRQTLLERIANLLGLLDELLDLGLVGVLLERLEVVHDALLEHLRDRMGDRRAPQDEPLLELAEVDTVLADLGDALIPPLGGAGLGPLGDRPESIEVGDRVLESGRRRLAERALLAAARPSLLTRRLTRRLTR